MTALEIPPAKQKGDLLSAIGDTLRAERNEKGLTLKQVAEAKDPTLVAIGSVEGAAATGLTVIRRGIGNHEEILHRYVALAREPVTYDARIPCRTSKPTSADTAL